MDICCFCSQEYPSERTALGYNWCIACAQAQPKLARQDFVVLGQHKSTPLVMSPDDPLVVAKVSYMNR
jgi:hypothetical protein